MQETENTGVIYMITNRINNKKYIGKAFSYEKHGKKPSSYYSALGRLRRHKSNANKDSDEVPLLYNDMRKYGTDNFVVETLHICLKDDLKTQETYYTNLHKTFDNDIGYNYFVGSNKPKDKNHIKNYEDNKVQSNKLRAIDGKLRQSDDVKDLPPNIYKRVNGLFAQIKINGTLYNKAFLSSKDSDQEKLQKATEWLNNIRHENGDIDV
jgi:group I intron endonuclease